MPQSLGPFYSQIFLLSPFRSYLRRSSTRSTREEMIRTLNAISYEPWGNCSVTISAHSLCSARGCVNCKIRYITRKIHYPSVGITNKDHIGNSEAKQANKTCRAKYLRHAFVRMNGSGRVKPGISVFGADLLKKLLCQRRVGILFEQRLKFSYSFRNHPGARIEGLLSRELTEKRTQAHLVPSPSLL